MSTPDKMTATEAAEWFISNPGTMFASPAGGVLLTLGDRELTALRRLLATFDADKIPAGPDLELFGMLTAAARQAPA